MWNIKNNQGTLYATPEQMECFSDERSRFKVLLADLELENVNLSMAEKKFRQLIDDKDIRLNREQTAYCVFGLAISLMGQLKSKEAVHFLENFKPGRVFNKTKSAPRALLNLAICYTTISDMQVNAIPCYEYIVQTFPKTKYADNAFFYLAEIYYKEDTQWCASNSKEISDALDKITDKLLK